MTIKVSAKKLFDVLGVNGEHWVKGSWKSNDGGICLHGAIRECAPRKGDAYLIEQVASCQGWGTSWNDATRTRWEDIQRKINGGIVVTDKELEETFGPQWQEIVVLVRKVASLTSKQKEKLGYPAYAAYAAATDAYAYAYAAATTAATDAYAATTTYAYAYAYAYAATTTDAYAAAATTADAYAAAASRYTARGLAVRHLIGSRGFTQVHYDTLTGPWRRTIGRIHPDDAELS